MKNRQIIAYYPVKQESERVKGKNLRLFNKRPLFTVMFDTLYHSPCISKIIVDTDSSNVAWYVSMHGEKAQVIDRAKHLRGNDITMNTLLDHFLETHPGEHFLQTQATNPLLSAETIEEAVNTYFDELEKHDSLFGVNRFQNRFYDHAGKPVNHSLDNLERTQDMQPLFEENSLFFIFSRKSFYDSGKSRIGKSPLLFETKRHESIGLDCEDDFRIAELVERHKHLFRQE